VGAALPDFLCELFSGEDLPARMGEAILIATTDASGWSHPAMLSYGEIVALDRHRLRLALYRTSRTADNLRRNGKLTVCLIRPNMAYYIKAGAEQQQDPMEGFDHLVCFEVRVEMVLADQARDDIEPGASIIGGILFAPGRPMEETLQGWRAVVQGLRRNA